MNYRILIVDEYGNSCTGTNDKDYVFLEFSDAADTVREHLMSDYEHIVSEDNPSLTYTIEQIK